MVDSKAEIIKEIQSLIGELEQINITVKQAWLFGSHASGLATSTSDIDVALVSDDFQGIRFLDKQRINPFLLHHDSRLDIHPYKTTEFNEDENWFVKEILRDSIRIS